MNTYFDQLRFLACHQNRISIKTRSIRQYLATEIMFTEIIVNPFWLTCELNSTSVVVPECLLSSSKFARMQRTKMKSSKSILITPWRSWKSRFDRSSPTYRTTHKFHVCFVRKSAYSLPVYADYPNLRLLAYNKSDPIKLHVRPNDLLILRYACTLLTSMSRLNVL